MLENCRIYKRRYEIDKTKESYSDLSKKKLAQNFFFVRVTILFSKTPWHVVGSCITWLDLELHMKAFLQWRNLTSLRLQNIAMSKTEFPFEKLASVWLQVSSFTSFTTFAFICGFVVTPLWVRREVCNESRNYILSLSAMKLPTIYILINFLNVWRFFTGTLAKKINSQGNTLEIGYISCIPEIPNKILPALFFPFLYFLINFFIYNAQFVSFVVVE